MSARGKNKETKTNENTKEGADTMSSNVGYAPLNLDLIKSKKSKIVSSDSALKDVTPIPWSNDIITGKKKAIFTTKEKNQ
jgi:hypothetical protein